jgi:hypothetical protein
MVEPSKFYFYLASKGQFNIINHKVLPIRDIIDFPIRNYFK